MERLKQHYLELLAQHGDDARAVQHFDHASQSNRFQALSEVAADLGSVVDLGCGLGHLCDYLRERGFRGRYLGLDFVDAFIERASRRHAGSDNTEFRVFDLGAASYPQGYDTYFACGIFNNAGPDNEQFLTSTLAKAYHAAGARVAFNALSTYVDSQDPALYYCDPLFLFDHCKRNLTKRVTLRHDYVVREDRLPYEYAIYLYKP